MDHPLNRPLNRPLLLLAPMSVAWALLSGCSTTPIPTDQMAVSTAAVASAVSAGGSELAPSEMKTARDKLDLAQAAMAAKDYDRARMLAMEVEADARLAEVRARSTKTRRAAAELEEASRVLREEMNRKTR